MAEKSLLEHDVKHSHCGVCGSCLLEETPGKRYGREVRDGYGKLIGFTVSPHHCPEAVDREVLEVYLLDILPWERRGGRKEAPDGFQEVRT